MSRGEVLYVKGINLSDSEDLEEEEDIWDDTKLNEAYDKAVSIANTEIAKRIAMATNKASNTENLKEKKKGKKNTTLPQKSKKIEKHEPTPPKTEWKVGMPCRAVYDADGVEYEAFLLRIINDKECIVRFLGYDNSEIVALDSLKPSLGNKERSRQIQDALSDVTEGQGRVGYESAGVREMECESEVTSVATSERSHQRRKKPNKKKNRNASELPTPLPFQLPGSHMNNINLGSLDIPLPPPPAALPDGGDDGLSSMLLSWYMTGYYTGLYQGVQRAKNSHKHHH